MRERGSSVRTSATGPRKSPAAEEARKVLARFKASTLPVPVEAIAEQLGARLSFGQYEGDVSGFVARRPGTVVIGVNSSHPQTRQRFTIAHEIGHLRMHEGKPLIVDKLVRVDLRRSASLPNDRAEVEANRFAACLLMPEDHVRREFEKFTSKRAPMQVDSAIGKLASTFAVSHQAMAYRLRELDLLAELGLY